MKQKPSFIRKIYWHMAVFAILPLCALLLFSLVTDYRNYKQKSRQELQTNLLECESDMMLLRSQTESAMKVLVASDSISKLSQARTNAEWIAAYNSRAFEEATRAEAYLTGVNAKVILIYRPRENSKSFIRTEHWATLLRSDRYDSIEAYTRFVQGTALAAWCGVGPALPQEVAESFDYRTVGNRLIYLCKLGPGIRQTEIVMECAVSTDPFINCVRQRMKEIPCSLISNGQILYAQGDTPRHGVEEELIIPELGLELQACIPTRLLVSGYLSSRRTQIPFLLLAGLLLTLISRRALQQLLARMEHLAASADQIRGDQTERLPEDGDDEVGRVIRAINRLLERIEEQNQEQVRQEKDKRRNQALALQYQLNPHFLFNSLQWVQMEMERQGVPEQQTDSIALLAKVLRYNLTESLTAKLQEELDHVHAYTLFMAEMKQEIIQLEADCPTELSEETVPRFILQPLVENALQHGLIPGKALHIWVRIRSEKTITGSQLLLQVTNDGSLIPEEQLNRIQGLMTDPQVKNNRGYGLANLVQRLKLTYGQQFSMDAESRLTDSKPETVFSLRIPIGANISPIESQQEEQ